MKKIVSTLFLTMTVFAMTGQTIVNTNVEDKNVILEEFTGIHCVFCPQGHVIAQAIQDNNPGDVYLINIHTGSFANPSSGEPDFRTPFGPSFANQSGLTGYPAGTVNRLNFPGQEQGNSGTTAMSRNQWTSASNTVLGQTSYVNVAVEAEIDIQTNLLNIHVEAYYTSDSPSGTNLLNVALLQNNTTGPQTGGGQGDNYVHMHRLIDMITGQWGIEIPTTTSGTFVDETFSFPIPSDYNGVPVEITNLELVAFVTETHQGVANGSGATPTFTGIISNNDANLRSIDNINNDCQTSVSPVINVQNIGQNEITSLDIEYSINGGTIETYNWTGSILSLYSADITLPEILNLSDTNNIVVSIQDDEDNTNNSITADFEGRYAYNNNLYLTINTDSNGAETTWELVTPEGVLTSGGPYENNETITRNINVSPGCYTFHLYDSNSNGGATVTLQDFSGSGETIYETDGNYGALESQDFAAAQILSTPNNELQNIVIYPNPVSSTLNINNAENATIEIYDVLGKLILTKSNISIDEQVNVSKLQTGTYFIKIARDNQISTEKFIVTK